MTLPSYSSLCHIGHRSIAEIFDGPVLVQEKIDGSQISFGVKGGELYMRSKGATLNLAAPDKMFANGVYAVQARKDKLVEGYVYRGEYLKSPKHNSLAYDRVPDGFIALFDIEDTAKGEQYFLPEAALAAEAARLGFSVAPTLFAGTVTDLGKLRDLLDTVSCLGGAKVEGVVVKNYARFTPDHKVMMGKFVSEAFKEIHAGEWKKTNPTQGDVQAKLINGLSTPARYAKAVQHLRDAGQLEGSTRDIGKLIKEVQTDIEKECAEEITDALLEHFMPHILRGVVGGLPEWYKQQMLVATHSANDNVEQANAA